MTDTVLVTYGTTNGSTAEIAEAVAEVLRKSGLTVEALPARSVTSVARYDAVVVGGGLYAGRWHKDARRFVRRNRVLLAQRPVWFFSSGPLDASASERHIPPVRGVQKAMSRLDVRDHVTISPRRVTAVAPPTECRVRYGVDRPAGEGDRTTQADRVFTRQAGCVGQSRQSDRGW
ncbi:flavodoxin domain-containing protein [Streptomyces sp. NPDC002623]